MRHILIAILLLTISCTEIITPDMGRNRTTTPDKIDLSVGSLQELHNIPISLRSWGMRVTVYDADDFESSTTWNLIYGGTGLGDNTRWAPDRVLIPNWNMDFAGDASKDVPIEFPNPIGAECYIYDDDTGLIIRNLKDSGTFYVDGQAGLFKCTRIAAGTFCNGSYDGISGGSPLSYRGFIKLFY